jgi:glycerol-3-phosphate dehydrogenase (NAD(P)+)
LGKAIGEGRDAAALMADRRTVAEGAYTAPVLKRVAEERNIDMPIVTAVDALLRGAESVEMVLEALMARPPRAESH